MDYPQIPSDIAHYYEVHQWRNALAVLEHAHGEEWSDILTVLRGFEIRKEDIAVGGGRKSPVANKLDDHFYELGWQEKAFETSITVDSQVYETPTHKVDCFKNRVALEIEWNNKDPFYDRDLNNFRLLFDLRAIDVGAIVTRCDELQELFVEIGRGASYGASTTHMSRLLPRIEGGGGGGCPIIVFGIKRACYFGDD